MEVSCKINLVLFHWQIIKSRSAYTVWPVPLLILDIKFALFSCLDFILQSAKPGLACVFAQADLSSCC